MAAVFELATLVLLVPGVQAMFFCRPAAVSKTVCQSRTNANVTLLQTGFVKLDGLTVAPVDVNSAIGIIAKGTILGVRSSPLRLTTKCAHKELVDGRNEPVNPDQRVGTVARSS